jgi:hypothetical protein
MIRNFMALAVLVLMIVGLGCSASNPTTPGRDMTVDQYFNQFDLSSPVAGQFMLSDNDGNVISTGLLGKNENGFYILNDRSSQVDVHLEPLGIVDISITYNNPAGTIPDGPNAGLPYYYVGQTIDYDINVDNMDIEPIGFDDCGADLTVEMRYASWDGDGNCVPGDLLPGDPVYTYNGVFDVGLTVLNDTYYIPGGTTPGLDCTTAKLIWDMCDCALVVWYFDDCAGVWDPK